MHKMASMTKVNKKFWAKLERILAEYRPIVRMIDGHPITVNLHISDSGQIDSDELARRLQYEIAIANNVEDPIPGGKTYVLTTEDSFMIEGTEESISVVQLLSILNQSASNSAVAKAWLRQDDESGTRPGYSSVMRILATLHGGLGSMAAALSGESWENGPDVDISLLTAEAPDLVPRTEFKPSIRTHAQVVPMPIPIDDETGALTGVDPDTDIEPKVWPVEEYRSSDAEDAQSERDKEALRDFDAE